MSVDKDSKGEGGGSPVERPPAVSERLWALIPADRQAAFRKEAALALRRGIHPETYIADRLEKDGIRSFDEIDTALGAPAAGGRNDDAETVSVEAPHAATDTRDLPREAPARPMRPPLWPFGTTAGRRSDIPSGEIGSILHYDAGFEAVTAAEIEWMVLAAVAKDPCFVRRDPSNLRLLGCDLPKEALASIRAAVLFECDCVIADVRRRQSEGDPSSLTWLDPETLVL